MHKVILEVKDEAAILALAETLKQANIDHYLWNELPENIPTALALKPYEKSFLQPYLRKYKLFK